MKRFLMLVGVAVVAAAMYVAASPASRQAKAPTARQFKALKKQVASLSKSLKSLKADEVKVKANATAAVGFLETCFVHALPVNQFGTTTDGFLFGDPTAAPPYTARTALDVDTSATPGALVQVVEPSCVTSTAAGHALRSHLPLRAERAR